PWPAAVPEACRASGARTSPPMRRPASAPCPWRGPCPRPGRHPERRMRCSSWARKINAPGAFGQPLRLDHRSVAAADLGPAAADARLAGVLAVAEGVLRRRLLVYLDAPARRLVCPQVAVLERGRTGEYLAHRLVELRVL